MECRNIVKNLQINKNKSIGEVIVIVEGESEEFKIFKKICEVVLDYNYIPFKRNKSVRDELKSKTNKNSTFIISNTSDSSLESIFKSRDYREKLYDYIKNEIGKNPKNIPIYIIWDRDLKSNNIKVMKKALNNFKNSLDNDEEMNGLLLLSYPSVESYIITGVEKRSYKKSFELGEDIKNALKMSRASVGKIADNTVLLAIENMHRILLEFGIEKYDPSDFGKINKKIFNNQELNYNQTKKYRVLSLISIMFIDLGIITDIAE